MNVFNAITSAIFDVLLAPWGHALVVLDLVIWSLVAGVGALLVYKLVSNQKGIARAKDRVKLHLIEIRLWRNDLRMVAIATIKTLGQNTIYLGHNLLPMGALIVPMMVILIQLVAHFGYGPAGVGQEDLLKVSLRPDAGIRATEVRLKLPAGVELAAPPVRTPEGEAFWRIRAVAAGDHELELTVGDERLTKGWAVGGEYRKVPVKRTRGWEGFLYPGEAGIPEDSPFQSIELHYPPRSLPLVPDGELGVLLAFLVLSLAAGFGLKGVFGVTL